MGYKDADRQREYQREWHAKRRAEYFADKSCAKCGSTEQLELDHIDPLTKVHHNVWSWRQDRRDAELTKCQVLCSSCHKIKSHEQMPITMGTILATHGRRAMYEYHGCRCRHCKAATAAYRREYRARKRSELASA